MKSYKTSRAAPCFGKGVHSLFLAALVPLLATSAPAATLCVNVGGTGGCFSEIQAAVDAAANGDTITIDAGTFDGADIPDRRKLTLAGAGSASTFIEGTWRSFDVGERAKLTLTGMTLRNASIDGAYVRRAARVTLDDVVIHGFTHGLRLVTSSRLTATNTTFHDNTYPIHVISVDALKPKATIDLMDSTIRANFHGLSAAQSNVALLNTAIHDNDLYGIRFFRKLEARNCTISGNGNGIEARGARAKLTGVTITNNATAGVEAITFDGKDSKVFVSNSVISGNGSDCVDGLWVSRDHNLFGDMSGCTIVGKTFLSTFGLDPMLGPLQDNGGPTPTHELLAGSPAIDAGSPKPPKTKGFNCHPTDQRGMVRNGTCDIGAYEF